MGIGTYARHLRSAARAALEPFAPHHHVRRVRDLEAGHLRERGIRGVVFDLDNTLGRFGFSRLEDGLLEWLRAFHASGFHLGFLSNHDGAGRRALEAALPDHPFEWSAAKPFRAGFERILARLGLPPPEVAMVGDRVLIDVVGAKRAGLYTVLVDPVVAPGAEGISLRLQRAVEHGAVRAHRLLAGGED